MLTIGHAQKYASRATSFAYSSVIFTRVSGPGGNALTQPGEGDIGDTGTCACAAEKRPSKAMVAAVAKRTFRVCMAMPPIIAAATHDAPNSAKHVNGVNEDN